MINEEIARADVLRHFGKGEFSERKGLYPSGKETKTNERAIYWLIANTCLKVRAKGNRLFLKWDDECELYSKNYLNDKGGFGEN